MRRDKTGQKLTMLRVYRVHAGNNAQDVSCYTRRRRLEAFTTRSSIDLLNFSDGGAHRGSFSTAITTPLTRLLTVAENYRHR